MLFFVGSQTRCSLAQKMQYSEQPVKRKAPELLNFALHAYHEGHKTQADFRNDRDERHTIFAKSGFCCMVRNHKNEER